jgi:hypothetical protein
MVISFCLVIAPALRHETGVATVIQNPWPVVVALTYSWCGIILVSPLQQLTRRLAFVALTVLSRHVNKKQDAEWCHENGYTNYATKDGFCVGARGKLIKVGR